MRPFGILFVSLLAVSGQQAVADTPGVVGDVWSFTLPALDGSRFVRSAELAGLQLVNFWGRDCAPCRLEMPRLQTFARARQDWHVWLVATDAPAVAADALSRWGVDLPALRAGADVSGLMRSAGNRRGALPFSVGLRDGRVCFRHLGEMQHADLDRLLRDCRRDRLAGAAPELSSSASSR